MAKKITKRFGKFFVGNKPFNSRAAANKEATKDDKPAPKPTTRDKINKRLKRVVPSSKAVGSALDKIRGRKK